MTKQMVANSYAPFRDSPGYGNKFLDIPAGNKVDLLEIVPEVPYSGMSTTWLRVVYKEIVGYSYAGFFDPFENDMPQDIVDLSDIETSDPYDAKQYIMIDSRKKMNQCGEICCSYISDKKLSDVLSVWHRKAPNVVSRIWKGTADRGTSAGTLIDLCNILGMAGGAKLNTYFKDELLGRTIFTLERAKKAMRDNYIILGVKIGNDGYIGTGNIGHWVTLIEVEVYGSQGVCTVFNPFNNKLEIYSWAELVKNSANIDGLVVPKGNEVFVPPEVISMQSPSVPDLIPDEKTMEEKVDWLWEHHDYGQSAKKA